MYVCQKVVFQVYSINVCTPKIGFSDVLFIERFPHITVSPFPTDSNRLNPKQHTKQQLTYTSIFLRHSGNLAQLQKDMSF